MPTPGSPRLEGREGEGRDSSSTSGQADMSWDRLARSLRLWLRSLLRAQSVGQHITVLKLMEVLLTFMETTNDGSFLRMLTPGEDVLTGLTALGATEAFINAFMETLQVLNLDTATIMSFGASPEAVQILRETLLAQSTFGGASPPRGRLQDVNRGTHAARRSRSLPQVPTARDEPLDVIPAWDATADGSVQQVTSIELFSLPNAVVINAASLPIAVVQAMSEDRAIPFIVFRYLTTFYAEVLFCVQYAQTTYVLGSKIIYVGPRKNSQLEGTLALPSTEKGLLLTGTHAIEWHHVAGFLEGSFQSLTV